MGSIFKPKMPALPPVQPLPEPPSAELSPEKKQESKRNKLRLKEEEWVEKKLFLLDH
jgi:hypothetical protein